MDSCMIVLGFRLSFSSLLQNVLVDGSLRDAEWYRHYFDRIRKDFPVVKIAIIQVSAPREAVFQRAAVSVVLFLNAFLLESSLI